MWKQQRKLHVRMKVEAKKYTLSYDEYENDVHLLDKILKDKHLPEYKQITIGCWDYEGEDCSALLKGILENKDKFAQIEGLFWGYRPGRTGDILD